MTSKGAEMLRRFLTPGAALGLLLSASAAARDIEHVSTSMTPRQVCENLLQVSLAKVGPGAPAADRTGVHAAMQSRWDAPPASATVVLSLLVGGGMGSHGPAGVESVVAWREPSGTWFARRAEEPTPGLAQGPDLPLAPAWPDPAPKPLVEGHLPAPGGLQLSSGPLPAAQAAQLDRALASESCLDREPASLPAVIPLRGGGSASCVPDAAWHELEVRRGDTVQRFSRACWSIGPVGLISTVLDGAALPRAPEYRARADLYNGTDNPTAPALRDFLSARLPGLRFRDAGGEGVVAAVRERAACDMALSLRDARGNSREVTLALVSPGRSYRAWIDDGGVALGEDGADPSLIAPGTVLALQVQGALFHLAHLCAAEP